MEILKYALLGIVQGLTEFLPVSSSGHLVLLEHWMNVQTSGLALIIALHVATTIAVLIIYGKDIVAIFREGRWAYLGQLMLCCLVTAIVFLPFRHKIEALANDVNAPRYIGFALILTGLWQFFADWRLRRDANAVQGPVSKVQSPPTPAPDIVNLISDRLQGGIPLDEQGQRLNTDSVDLADIVMQAEARGNFDIANAGSTPRPDPGTLTPASLPSGQRPITFISAAIMGLAMGISGLLRGFSRSGSTIGTGIQLGVAREEAAKFSFLSSVPIVLGGAVLEAKDSAAMGVLAAQPVATAVGFLCSLVAGIFAILFVRWALQRAKLSYFGLYCLLIGAVAIVVN